MGLSSNQARFLSLTSRQIDLEQRVQQICQRRLRLSSELEKVATQYNNSISNRKLFIPTQNSLQQLSLENIEKLGYKVINTQTKNLVNAPVSSFGYTPISEASAIANGYDANHIIHNANEFVQKITNDLGGNFIMTGNIDMSALGPLSTAAIDDIFTGNFDGNGYSINNMDINTLGSGLIGIGLFKKINTGAFVSNLAINNASINAANNNNVGIITGSNSGTITNVHVSGNVTGGASYVGGLTGISSGSIINSSSTADVTGSDWKVGGIVGEMNGSISGSYASGNVTALRRVGGIAGFTYGTSSITNSFATGDVTGTQELGGFVGYHYGGSITNSYTTGDVIGSGSNRGGFIGLNSASADATNFYQNNMSNSGGAAVNINAPAAMPTGSWDPAIWDLSGATPQLQTMKILPPPTGEEIEQRLRSGEYSLIAKADEFTQSPMTIDGETYEEKDWRTIPELNDELFKSDDSNAESKYDVTIAEINSQDKKLQLEQSSVEIEYKAISSEKDAVKKILETNAQSSFKYFG